MKPQPGQGTLAKDPLLARRVVITGSTRGLGYGMAEAFLQAGCAVLISGRNQAAVDQVVSNLAARFGAANVAGQACDVTVVEQLQALWAAAQARWGGVDIWINNAGISSGDLPLLELPPSQIRSVVETNLIGTLLGSQVAAAGMSSQGGGFIYNLDGFGSTGQVRRGMAPYGSTKAAIHYLTRALAADLAGTPVKVGSLSPGMVITDLLTEPYAGRPTDWQRARRIFNILADRVETVAPWLVHRMLTNQRNGARLAWLTPARLYWRFLTAPFNRRDLFAGDADR
jgi:NAD(P)-dependent dehydrogenase (short-subunit alcohol dehydrogenase family)